ncbi:hypothetical protein NL676_023169 [Syzygium grande]|nr:hypothetical protein NL676_023169 [Syzygium grande]
MANRKLWLLHSDSNVTGSMTRGLVELGNEGRAFLVDAGLCNVPALVVVARIYFLRAYGVGLPSIVPAGVPSEA